jgi:hypothetical protein
MGVSDPGERLWPGLSSSGHGRCGQPSGTRIPLGKNRRELTAGAQSIDGPHARSYAWDQAAALASSSYPEATLVLVPASRAASWLLTTQVDRSRVRAFQEPAYKAELLAITQLAARALVLA